VAGAGEADERHSGDGRRRRVERSTHILVPARPTYGLGFVAAASTTKAPTPPRRVDDDDD
jgi:hypothetical protein